MGLLLEEERYESPRKHHGHEDQHGRGDEAMGDRVAVAWASQLGASEHATIRIHMAGAFRTKGVWTRQQVLPKVLARGLGQGREGRSW